MKSVSAPVITVSQAPSVGAGSEAARAVARRLTDLATEPALVDRQEQLRTLAQALSDRDYSAGWEDLSLHAALGYPIMPEAGRSKLARWLGGARVALVFMPIAVTWAGVSWAGWLYQQELARDPELGAQSFFRLWLAGFNGAMPSFHVMAVIIALAVFAIIGSTVWIGRDEERAAARRRHVQATLQGLLTEATVHLARGRPGSPERFIDDLTRTSDGMTALVTQVRSATEAATTSMQSAAVATDAAREAAIRAEQGAGALAGSTHALVDAVSRSEAATTRLLSDAIARGDAAAQAVTTAVSTTAGGLADAVTTLRRAVDELSARQDHHRDELGRQLDAHRDRIGLRLDEHEQATWRSVVGPPAPQRRRGG
jgi:hypothetical protein